MGSEDALFGSTDAHEHFGEPAGFAQLVAEIALSFLDQSAPGPRPTLVEQIVAGAVSLIPGTFAAAVVDLNRDRRLQSPLSVGDDVARLVMHAQNDTGQGPCLDALRDTKQVVVDDLLLDPRWPAFSARVVEVGVRALICTPLVAAGRRLGGLTLMSRSAEFAYGEDTASMAAVFTAHAAVAMTGARQLEDMTAALTHRDLIGQAKGILMERFNIADDVAFATLVRASSVTNLKLRQVCERLCDTGVLSSGMDPEGLDLQRPMPGRSGHQPAAMSVRDCSASLRRCSASDNRDQSRTPGSDC